MNPTYKFLLDSNASSPHFKEDLKLAKETKRESSFMFFRESISSDWVYSGADASYINAQPRDKVFSVEIQKLIGGTYQTYYKGKFTKLSCKFDLDRGQVIANVDTVDSYVKVLEQYEQEVNIIPLNPQIKYLTLWKRPLIQVYVKGESYLSCFIGGSSWEQDCTSVDDHDTLLNTYKFAFNRRMIEVTLSGSGIEEGARGAYTGIYDQGDGHNYSTGTILQHTSGNYTLKVVSAVAANGVNSYNGIALYNQQQQVLAVSKYSPLWITDPYWEGLNGYGLFMVGVSSVTSNGVVLSNNTTKGEAYQRSFSVYSRLLLNNPKYQGSNTYNLPVNDLGSDNLNYRRAVPFTDDLTAIEGKSSDSYTKYGLRDDGKYYTPPTPIPTGYAFPIATRTWGKASLWFNYYGVDKAKEVQGRFPNTDKSCFTLASVINVLLKRIDPALSHLATPEYSKFFYNAVNPISGLKFEMLISQKSNMLHGINATPAKKAMLSLKTIMDSLEAMFKCHWHIEDNKFIIEHVSYYQNGRSYSGTPSISVDTTTTLDSRTGKPYSVGTNSYEYDKLEVPYKYTFSFMDKCTQSFEGTGMFNKSDLARKDVTSDVTLNQVTTDIDYIQVNVAEISSDGYVLFAAIQDSERVGTPLQGRVNAQGVVINTSQEGVGWLNYKFRCVPEAIYEVRNVNNILTDNIVINYYDSTDTHLYQTASTQGTFTTPVEAYYVSISWRDSSAGIPNNIPVTTVNSLFSVQLSLPFVNRVVDNVALANQNGYLAFPELCRNYHLHDSPVSTVTLEGIDYPTKSLKKLKKQTVDVPTWEDLDPLQSVKTGLGVGQVSKISVSLSSRMANIDLNLD